jgi:hypothetical protein
VIVREPEVPGEAPCGEPMHLILTEAGWTVWGGPVARRSRELPVSQGREVRSAPCVAARGRHSCRFAAQP